MDNLTYIDEMNKFWLIDKETGNKINLVDYIKSKEREAKTQNMRTAVLNSSAGNPIRLQTINEIIELINKKDNMKRWLKDEFIREIKELQNSVPQTFGAKHLQELEK